ncbi:cytochrome b-c1 complex subunit 6, mitochondrial-like [Planococcus citri]|uniref:cytochrome b-c1 complex subunit 6, mitochondrial-like n=1 Tax=Planococcus citri TaxID=170843 RepID=UPI0031F7365D
MVLEFFKSIFGIGSPFVKFPVVRADDDDDDDESGLEDPFTGLKANCANSDKGKALKQRLEECNARVRSRKQTAETCEEELHDLVHFIDHCAAKDLFKYLK